MVIDIKPKPEPVIIPKNLTASDSFVEVNKPMMLITITIEHRTDKIELNSFI